MRTRKNGLNKNRQACLFLTSDDDQTRPSCVYEPRMYSTRPFPRGWRAFLAWLAAVALAWAMLPCVAGNDVGVTTDEGIYANIQPVNSTAILDRLKQVPLKLYEYKMDNTSGRQQMGFLSSDIM